MKQLVLALATTLASLGLMHFAVSGLECWIDSSQSVVDRLDISNHSIPKPHIRWPKFHRPCFGLCTELEDAL